jgi:hypothetical protein
VPKGTPKAGFRRTKKRMMMGSGPVSIFKAPVTFGVPEETEEQKSMTDEQIMAKIENRFSAMDKMTTATCKGQNRALIVSGPPGLGKTYAVMKAVEAAEKRGFAPTVVKGFVRATGLYKLFYENRSKKSIVVLDDADSIFSDEDCLSILKTATDMTEKRVLHWLAETNMEDASGEKLPRSFEFEGSVIFVTNYDFDVIIEKGSKLAPHMEALISRSHYLDLGMKSKRDYVIRIKQVVGKLNMLINDGFTKVESDEIMAFVIENKNKMRELSLRMVVKVAGLLKIDKTNWKALAKVTCMRNAA